TTKPQSKSNYSIHCPNLYPITIRFNRRQKLICIIFLSVGTDYPQTTTKWQRTHKHTKPLLVLKTDIKRRIFRIECGTEPIYLIISITYRCVLQKADSCHDQ